MLTCSCRPRTCTTGWTFARHRSENTLGRDNALKLNLEMALNNGASLQEIFEALFQVAAYAGFPAAWDAIMLAEVLNERDGAA